MIEVCATVGCALGLIARYIVLEEKNEIWNFRALRTVDCATVHRGWQRESASISSMSSRRCIVWCVATNVTRRFVLIKNPDTSRRRGSLGIYDTAHVASLASHRGRTLRPRCRRAPLDAHGYQLLCECVEGECISKPTAPLPAIVVLVPDPATQRQACTALDALRGDGSGRHRGLPRTSHGIPVGLFDTASLNVKAASTGAIGSAAHATRVNSCPSIDDGQAVARNCEALLWMRLAHS